MKIERRTKPTSEFSEIAVGEEFYYKGEKHLKVSSHDAFDTAFKQMIAMHPTDIVLSLKEAKADGHIPFKEVPVGEVFHSSRWYFMKVSDKEEETNAFNLTLRRTAIFTLDHDVKPVVESTMHLTVSEDLDAD